VLKDSGYDIWFDGMGKKNHKNIPEVPKFLHSAKDLKKAFKNVNVVHSDHGRSMAAKGDVIVTSSGMMDGGPVLSYMNKLKNDKKSGSAAHWVPNLRGPTADCLLKKRS